MKRILTVIAILLGLAAAVRAQTVSINLDAGALESALGLSAEPAGGLLQLIASPSGTFSAPTSTAYVTGGNVLVQSFPMNNVNGPAETSSGSFLTGLALSTSSYTLTANEALELRFYPSLTYASMPAAPTLGTTYGEVRSSTIEFGPPTVASETAWVVPGSGSTVDFEYVTVSNGGTYSNASAYADDAVLAGSAVPEPSTFALMGCAALGLIGLRLRKDSGAV